MTDIEKRIEGTDLSDMAEPVMSELDWTDFRKGIELFNQGQFWESHEAWEGVWKRHPENSRIFFQGLIQVAAGLHQLHRGIYHGAIKHYSSALWKLKRFQAHFLGVNVNHLVEKVEQGLAEIKQLGEKNLERFDKDLIPKIKCE
ncbi:MAG: DUF309 domain-containing protein [bacterium]